MQSRTTGTFIRCKSVLEHATPSSASPGDATRVYRARCGTRRKHAPVTLYQLLRLLAVCFFVSYVVSTAEDAGL